MAHHFNINPVKTYATQANAVKAVEKRFGPNEPMFGAAELHYLTVQDKDGRWFPVFFGERALRAGVHHHFNVIA